jgi:hypothetical protein
LLIRISLADPSEIVANPAGITGWSAFTGAAIDALLAIVLDLAALTGTALGKRFGLAPRVLLLVQLVLAAAPATLVILAADRSRALPLSGTDVGGEERKEPPQLWQDGQQAEEAASAASPAQHPSQRVEALAVHRTSTGPHRHHPPSWRVPRERRISEALLCAG